jgi:transposase
MYRVHLSDEQRRELHQRAHAQDVMPRTRDRLELVRLSDAGFSIPWIARHLGQSEGRVRHWIKQFLAEGFDALPDQPHPGQKSAVTPAMIAALPAAMADSPQAWTARQIADWVADRYGVRRSPRQISRLVARAKQSYKRTQRGLKHKQHPEQVAKKNGELAVLEKGGGGSD